MKKLMNLAFVMLLGVAHAQDPDLPEHHQHATESSATPGAESHAGHESMGMSGQNIVDHEMVEQPEIDPDDAEYYPNDLMSMSPGPFGLLLVDQLEYRLNDGDDLLRWDAEGWYGGDFNRFWFKTEGEQTLQGPGAGAAEVHGYYGRLIAPFWDAQVGVRYDQQW